MNLKGEIEKSEKFVEFVKRKLSGGEGQNQSQGNEELTELEVEEIFC